MVILSGGCTSLAQPMDVSINKPFKDKMRELWMEWRRSGSTCRTRMGNLKQPTRQDSINWVSAAWEAVAEDIVAYSFLSCGISNSLDGSEDCHIRDVIPTDVEEESEGEEGLDGDEEVDGLGEMENEEEDGGTETGGTETEVMEAGGMEADGREADGMAASREEAEESEN